MKKPTEHEKVFSEIENHYIAIQKIIKKSKSKKNKFPKTWKRNFNRMEYLIEVFGNNLEF